MTYCQRGRELLSDLQRSDFLPQYDEEGVRQVINEIADLANKITTTMLELEVASDATKVSNV